MNPKTKSVASGLLKGNVVALCLHSGGCPIGIVTTIRKNSVQLELFDWLLGMFDGSYIDVPISDIARMENATYMVDRPGHKTFELDYLASVQKEWQERNDKENCSHDDAH